MDDPCDSLETLFLLEVLVDSVNFDRPSSEELKETCVGFQFLNYPPLIICEEDFIYLADDEFARQNVPFKSGKSVLFALPSLLEGKPNLGNIKVWVTRRVARTDKTKTMGTTNINLTGSFEDLLQASAKRQDVCPDSKFIKDTFTFNENGRKVGTIWAFLRISCFGKLIVTQFEVKGKDMFNFKGLAAEKDGDQKKGCGKKTGGSQGPSKCPSAGPQYPGMGPCGQYPGQMMGPGQGLYPGMGGPCSSGAGMFPGQQMGADLVQPWGSKRVHCKKGTIPCGEPRCPLDVCRHFPCQHAPPCGQPQCAAVLANMGILPGERAIGRNQCPTDRIEGSTPEDIAAAMNIKGTKGLAAAKGSKKSATAKGGKKSAAAKGGEKSAASKGKKK